MEPSSENHTEVTRTELRRSLNLPLLTLYGLGVTVGAGIYVLIGATAAIAGIYAPMSFLLAAGVVAFTGFSYAELTTRFPVSAGEAAYVLHGLNLRSLSLFVGLLVVFSGIVSSAAISIGAAAYLRNFIDIPDGIITLGVIAILALAAVWGVVESVTIAAIFTLIEIGGLILVVGYGLAGQPEIVLEVETLLPPFEYSAWIGIYSASLLAFFAFVGFEDMANVAEEVKTPGRTMPWAIILTLIIASILYFLVTGIVVLVVPMAELTASKAPLSLVFADASREFKALFDAIAVIATVNGVLIQMIMASRVLYGLARQGSLPRAFSAVNPTTQTPIVATITVAVLVLIFASLLPISELAELTSGTVLVVFSLVNLALIRLKRSHPITTTETFSVPLAIPIIGLVSCLGLLMSVLI